MTDTLIRIRSTDDGIELSQQCPSPEWSINGRGGRTDVVDLPDAELPRILKVIRQRLEEIEGVSA
jgi:hypothetical protein